jgi:Zn-dependent protease with chaperone function
MNEDRATRYHRSRRRIGLASMAAAVALLIALVATGRSTDLAVWSRSAVSSGVWPLRPVLAVTLYVGALSAAWEVVSFPFVFSRSYLLDRKYGLSNEPLSTWLADHCKALALGLLLTVASAVGVYASIRLSPGWWWLIATGLFAVFAVAVSRVAPVWLLPLFYRFRPLDRESLRERLLSLSSRAGVRVLGAFEWGLGDKTSRANAALVGAGHTRRILVSDTLLKDYSDDEIEVILAHELAHHVHHDMWSALALETVLVGAALLTAHVVLTRGAAALGVAGPGDLAALPILVLAAGAASLLLAPLTSAWSRHNERRADRFALALTGRTAAFVSAMKRLGAQNLAEERPSRLVFWFFHTHPTIEERIARAQTLR